MTLEKFTQLLEGESPRILMDASVVDLTTDIPGIEDTMNAFSFENMSVETLEALVAASTRYTEVLQSDKILVIPEVSEEWGRYVKSFDSRYDRVRGISNKTSGRMRSRATPTYKRPRIDYLKGDWDLEEKEEGDLEESENGNYRTSRRKSSKRTVTEQESLYKETQNLLKQMQRTLYSKQVIIRDPLYEELKEAVIEMVAVGRLKSGSHPVGRWVYEDIHTDEILIATGIYLATRDKELVTVASRDSSFPRILIYTHNLLSAAADGIAQLLHENPTEVCYLVMYEGPNSKAGITTTNTTRRFAYTFDGINSERVQRVAQGLLKL